MKNTSKAKIRRQYFNMPLIILYSLALAIPYFIFVISLGLGKLDFSELPSTFLTSAWIFFCFSLPLLLLRELNKHFFGKIVCVLAEDGIRYQNAMLRWDSIEKIEYAVDSKPRYKSDSGKAFRAIVFTKGGRHIVLENAPLRILYCIRKYRKSIDVRISGATALLTSSLIVAALLALCPFYVLLLVNSSGASMTQWIVMVIISVVLGAVRLFIFDTYVIQYRFWRKILPKKWLSYVILTFYYSSFFVAVLVLSYFPSWITVAILGIYLGVVQPPVPSSRGSRFRNILSYEQLYDAYVSRADYWEKKIAKNQKNNT